MSLINEECTMVYLVEGFGKIQNTQVNTAAAFNKVLDYLTDCKYNMNATQTLLGTKLAIFS
jgi:hypothetical protein